MLERHGSSMCFGIWALAQIFYSKKLSQNQLHLGANSLAHMGQACRASGLPLNSKEQQRSVQPCSFTRTALRNLGSDITTSLIPLALRLR